MLHSLLIDGRKVSTIDDTWYTFWNQVRLQIRNIALDQIGRELYYDTDFYSGFVRPTFVLRETLKAEFYQNFS